MTPSIKHQVLCWVLLLLCLSPSPNYASGSSIGIHFDPEGTTCSAAVAAYAPVTIYVIANLMDPLAGGISAASFKLVGLPSGWFTTPTPNPQASVVGDPLQGGCHMWFSDCVSPTAGRVQLYSIFAVPLSPPGEIYLQVLPVPCPCQWPVVSLSGCDAPYYTSYPVLGGAAIINGPPCSVGVLPATWSGVKQLYE
jgi:hypothetical protein